MKGFLVKGTVKFGGRTNTFSKEVQAETKGSAISKVKALFGSNYKVKGHMVKVEEVKELS